MNRHLFKRKAVAWLLTLAMLFSFTGGLGVSPGTAEAQDEITGDFLLNVGNYRGLNQEPSVPISVRNAQDLVALEFIVVSSNNYNIDVSIKSVERGSDLPGAASITWSGVGHGDVKIGIFMHEAGFSGNGELVRINFKHDATEQTYNQPISLNINPLDVTARIVEGELEEGQIFGDDSVELPITSSSISNGEIRVAIMFGDMDKNENVTVNDALLALRASVGDLELTPQLIDAGDVKRAPDAPGVNVTVYDALLIAKKAVGLIDFFPVYPDPDADPDHSEQTMFTIQPSAIFIGDYELTNPRTIIGGEVTFTVRFPTRIIGDVKLEVSGAQVTDTNTEFINGNEVDITISLTDHTGGLGERVVSAFQYNTITREEGVRLDRFVKVVEEANPRDLFIDDARNRQIDFEWNPTNAASTISIRQSIDGSAWTDARTLSPIKSTDTSATVAGLDPQRGYYFKLKVDGGVHHGGSDVLRFNRMTTDTIAERLGGDLHVIVLYSGEIKDLNPDRFGDFEMVNANGIVLATADSISMHQSRAIRVIFQGSAQEDFYLRYNGDIDTLDRNALSYVLSPDEAPVGKYGVVTEISVTTAQELSGALANSSVNRIAIGSDITLADATLDQDAQEIDGDGFTLNGNLTVTGNNARVSNLTITGNLTVDGNNFVGESLKVEGTTTINGDSARFNTTFEGPVTVDGDSATFTNVTFEDKLTINVNATGTRLINCTIMDDVTIDEDATFTDTGVADDLAITIDATKTLILDSTMDVANRTVTIEGSGDLEGDATISGTTGKVVFGDNDTGVDTTDLAFVVNVDVNQDVSFTDVELADDLTVTVASGKTLTLDGALVLAARRVFTFAGAGTVAFDVTDMTLEDAVFTIAQVNVLDDSTFADASINSSVTVDVSGTKTLTLAEDITVASGRTLTLDGAGNVESDSGTITGAGRLTISATGTISDLDVEVDTTITGANVTVEDITFTRAVAVNADVTFDGVRINGALTFGGTGAHEVTVQNTFRTAAVNTTGGTHVFNLAAGSVWTLTGGINTTGGLTLQGTGTITGAQTFSTDGTVALNGAMTIQNATFAGAVAIGSSLTFSGVSLNNAAATNVGAYTITVGSGGLTLGNAAQLLTLDNGSSKIAGTGTISGIGSIATGIASADIEGVTLAVNLAVGHNLTFTGGGWTSVATLTVSAGTITFAQLAGADVVNGSNIVLTGGALSGVANLQNALSVTATGNSNATFNIGLTGFTQAATTGALSANLLDGNGDPDGAKTAGEYSYELTTYAPNIPEAGDLLTVEVTAAGPPAVATIAISEATANNMSGTHVITVTNIATGLTDTVTVDITDTASIAAQP